MRSSSKQMAEKGRGSSSHMLTVHQRLYDALNLGFRSCDDQRREWNSADHEVQRRVFRLMDAFLDCISTETFRYPLVKESIGDMVGALEGILRFKNEAILPLASNVAVKMINILPNSVLQDHISGHVRVLISLISSHQSQVVVACVPALTLIFSNLHSKSEKAVWEILKDTNIVIQLVNNIQDFSIGENPIQYFSEVVSLLSKILWRWPPYRFCVWSNAKLMGLLERTTSLNPESPVKVANLQLYCAIGIHFLCFMWLWCSEDSGKGRNYFAPDGRLHGQFQFLHSSDGRI